MHRFSWDLHAIAPGTPPPSGMAAFFGGGGTAVLPGQYTVKLTVDGKSYSEPLAVKMDPGIHYRMEALQAQAQMVDQIKALQVKVGAAHDVAQLRRQLESLGPKAAGQKKLAAAITTLDQNAKQIEGFATPPSPDSSGEGGAEPAPDSLKGLSATLMKMSLGAQQGGVEPPTPAIAIGYGKVQKTVDATLARSHQLETTDVAQLNARLSAAKLPTVHL